MKILSFKILLIFLSINILYSTDIEYYNYAVFNYKSGYVNYAKEIYKQLTNSSLKDVAFRSNFNLGCIYLEKKNYDSAIVCFENAIKIDPFNYNAKYNYIYAKLKMNNEKLSISKINFNTNLSKQNKFISQNDILKIVKTKEEHSRKKYFNNLRIETPKSKYPW